MATFLSRKFTVAVGAAALALAGAAACSNSESASGPADDTAAVTVSSEPTDHDHGEHGDHGGHAGHDHPADGGPAPAGIAEAANPKYPVGTEVTLTADHMPGMDGANATISGAYDTIAYAIDYTPTTGGAPVLDHKWVVQEELQDAGTQRLADGTVKQVLADHMQGMEGAEATIASSTDETVYMVDIDDPDMQMKRHKWVVESEIQPRS